jgi:hypothetical protein
MPPFLAAFLAAAASNQPGGGQFRPVPSWPMAGSGFHMGFPGMPHPHHHLFKSGIKVIKMK